MRQVISPNQTVLWTRYELTELYGPMTSTRTAPAVKAQPVIIPHKPRRLLALIQRVIVSVEKVCRKVLCERHAEERREPAFRLICLIAGMIISTPYPHTTV